MLLFVCLFTVNMPTLWFSMLWSRVFDNLVVSVCHTLFSSSMIVHCCKLSVICNGTIDSCILHLSKVLRCNHRFFYFLVSVSISLHNDLMVSNMIKKYASCKCFPISCTTDTTVSHSQTTISVQGLLIKDCKCSHSKGSGTLSIG